MVRHLRGTVEHQTSALDVRIADVRFERRVLDLAGLVGALHDGVRLGEAFSISPMPPLLEAAMFLWMSAPSGNW